MNYKRNPMNNYCAIRKNHNCIKWMDYEITRHEPREADELFSMETGIKKKK